MDTLDTRAEFEKLQQELSTRQSTTHFAHAAVTLPTGLIMAGAAAKLFHDSAKVPYLGYLAAIVALGLVTYAILRFVRANRAVKAEATQFEKMMILRQALGLDDPNQLLPSK